MPYYGYKPAEQAIQIGDNTIVSADIADGSIVNADINSSAAIAMSKTQLTAGTGITLSTNTLNVDAAQTQITSLGTLTALQIDNVNIDGNTITTTNTNGTLTITPNGTGNVDLNTDRLNIQSTEGESTSIRLSADEGDDSGDDWLLLSNTDNTFTIGNDASGSNVAQIPLAPNSTVASSTTAIAGNTTVGGNLTLDGSSSRQIEFKDGSTSEGAIVFDEITNGLIFKVGGTSGSSKLDALKITSGGEFTMTSGSDMILNLVSTATNGKEYEIQSTDAGNLTFVRRTGSASEILRFSGSDDSATFGGDIKIATANNPALIIDTEEVGADTYKMYVGGTGLSFFNTTDTRGVYFKHDNDWQFGDANGTVNAEWYGEGNAKIVATAGSASNPTYSFNSDTSTGMYRPANVELSFATDGVERMTLDSHGNMIIKENTGDPDSSKMMFKSTKSYTDDEYENFALMGDSSLIIITNTTNEDGAVFFACKATTSVTLIADPNSEFASSDTDGRVCCYKYDSSNVFRVKNRRGFTKNLSVAVIGCGS